MTLLTKEVIIDGYVKELRNKVGNFDRKVQTSVLLMNFFKGKGYDFYFCPKIVPVNNQTQTFKKPDFHAHKETKLDLLGEIKQSLPSPTNPEIESMASADIKQLKDYKGELVGISTPHDVFFVAPTIANEAVRYYIDIIRNDPDLIDKIIVVKYGWDKRDSHSRPTLTKVYGTFSDKDIDDEFLYKSYDIGEGDLDNIQGEYKIYYTEDNDSETPIEYVMMVLWHNIIPELLKTSSFDETLNRIKKSESKLEFTIDEIKSVMDSMYVLKTYQGQTTIQFCKDLISRAMDGFKKINKAEILSNGSNPRYRITYTPIATGKADLIDYLIRELNKEDFESNAEVELYLWFNLGRK